MRTKAFLLSPLIVLLLSAARLLFISDYNTTTSLSMASAGGVAATLLGSVLPLLPPYLPVFAALAVYWRSWGTATVAAVLAALLSPAYISFEDAVGITIRNTHTIFDQAQNDQWASIWYQNPIPVAGAALGVIFAVLHAPYDIDAEEVKVATGRDVVNAIAVWIIRFSWGVVIALVGLVMMTFIQAAYKVPFDLDKLSQIMRSPWLPAEELTLADGSTQVGYTLSNAEGWFTVLEDQPRAVIYIQADSVKARSACTLSPSDTTPPFLPLRGSKITATRLCKRPAQVAVAAAEPSVASAGAAAVPSGGPAPSAAASGRPAPSAAATAQASPKAQRSRHEPAAPSRRADPGRHQCRGRPPGSRPASADRPGRRPSGRRSREPS